MFGVGGEHPQSAGSGHAGTQCVQPPWTWGNSDTCCLWWAEEEVRMGESPCGRERGQCSAGLGRRRALWAQNNFQGLDSCL